MFGADFRERNEAEVELKSIEDPEHLRAFLNAIYPHRIPPTGKGLVCFAAS